MRFAWLKRTMLRLWLASGRDWWSMTRDERKAFLRSYTLKLPWF